RRAIDKQRERALITRGHVQVSRILHENGHGEDPPQQGRRDKAGGERQHDRWKTSLRLHVHLLWSARAAGLTPFGEPARQRGRSTRAARGSARRAAVRS